jgi:excisionase family DNA binding protein
MAPQPQVVKPRQAEQLKLNLVLPLEDTIDVFTAARIARVHENTIRRWCEEGRLSANRIGKKWRVYRAPLYARIEAANNLPK